MELEEWPRNPVFKTGKRRGSTALKLEMYSAGVSLGSAEARWDDDGNQRSGFWGSSI